METQQMMEMLLKEMRANQLKADADRLRMEDKMEENRRQEKEERKKEKEEMLKEIRANQVKLDVNQKQTEVLLTKLDAYSKTGQEEEKPAPVDTKPATAQQEEVPIVIPVGATMACLVMEARQEEEDLASANRKPEVAELQEVPVQDAEVMPVGEPKKKRRRDRHRRNMKNPTRGSRGPQMKLAVVHRKVSRRATVAWRKRHIFKKSTTQGNCGPWHELAADSNVTSRAGATRRKGDPVRRRSTRVNAGQEAGKGRTGTVTGQTSGRRRQPQRKCSKGIRKQDVEELLRLREKTGNVIFSGRFATQVVGTANGLRRIRKWTLWRGRPPPKRKKEQGTEEEPVI
ncbi:hypothetical protein B7P43_G10918 [Cryptotermes secundus]|uniref:Uncharacterized protein n=1 Tax=Cryptotermes secundus TaxID=105785 RepID=A0A2J7Q9X6_9NEOP|nr:hypothetical protein B7P43_G10918 [Cryptotermes secundus]